MALFLKIIQSFNEHKAKSSTRFNFVVRKNLLSEAALSATFTTHKELGNAPSWFALGNGHAELSSCAVTFTAWNLVVRGVFSTASWKFAHS